MVSGSPIATDSLGTTTGAAWKIASHKPAGCGCTTKMKLAEFTVPPP
jgi:hypothetical protein